jgi:multiple sugar transport system permease protein
MTASVIALIPVLTIFAVFQKQIIESIALTGSKG